MTPVFYHTVISFLCVSGVDLLARYRPAASPIDSPVPSPRAPPPPPPPQPLQRVINAPAVNPDVSLVIDLVRNIANPQKIRLFPAANATPIRIRWTRPGLCEFDVHIQVTAANIPVHLKSLGAPPVFEESDFFFVTPTQVCIVSDTV